MADRYVLMAHVGEYSMSDTLLLGVFDTLEEVSNIKDEQFRGNNDIFIIKLAANTLYDKDHMHELCYTPFENECKEQEQRLYEQKRKEQEAFSKWKLERSQKEHAASLQRINERTELLRNDIKSFKGVLFSADVPVEVLEHVLDSYDEIVIANELELCAPEFVANKRSAHHRRMNWFASRMDVMAELLKNKEDIEAFNTFRENFEQRCTNVAQTDGLTDRSSVYKNKSHIPDQ